MSALTCWCVYMKLMQRKISGKMINDSWSGEQFLSSASVGLHAMAQVQSTCLSQRCVRCKRSKLQKQHIAKVGNCKSRKLQKQQTAEVAFTNSWHSSAATHTLHLYIHQHSDIPKWRAKIGEIIKKKCPAYMSLLLAAFWNIEHKLNV